MGLPDDELRTRGQSHRGVFCRPGLLLPTDSTLFALLPARDFNACLPLGDGRLLSVPPSGLLACPDPAALCARATLDKRDPADAATPYYVIQVEVDLLEGRLEEEEAEAGGDGDALPWREEEPLGPGQRRTPHTPGKSVFRSRIGSGAFRGSRAGSGLGSPPPGPVEARRASRYGSSALTEEEAERRMSMVLAELGLDEPERASPGAQPQPPQLSPQQPPPQQQPAPPAPPKPPPPPPFSGASFFRLCHPGLNVECIARVFLARRDAQGGFVTCDPPNGIKGH